VLKGLLFLSLFSSKKCPEWFKLPSGHFLLALTNLALNEIEQRELAFFTPCFDSASVGS